MPQQQKNLDYEEMARMARSTPGDTHLMAIAIDAYAHCPRLSNCVKDAKDFVALMQERYRVAPERTYTLYDEAATRVNILKALRDLRDKLQPDDSLLLYFSGHGEVADDDAFWVPVDGKPKEDWDWVPAHRIKQLLGAVPAFHTLVIVDACFAGSFFRAYRANERELLGTRPSRLGISASHSRERALDGRPGENSPFAHELLRLLRRNQQPLPVDQLFMELRGAVLDATRGEQTPIFKNIDVKGDEEGQYVFLPAQDEAKAWADCKAEGSLAAYQLFLAQFPDSGHAAAARAQIAALSDTADWQQAQAKGSMTAYLGYCSRHPKGAHRQAALAAIEALEDERDWQQAQQRGTVSAFLRYQAQHPQGQHRTAAEQAIQRLTEPPAPVPPPRPQPKPAEPVRAYSQSAPAAKRKNTGSSPTSTPASPAKPIVAILIVVALFLALWGVRQCNRPDAGSGSVAATEMVQELDAAMQNRSLKEVEDIRYELAQLPDSDKKTAQLKRLDTWITAYADSLQRVEADSLNAAKASVKPGVSPKGETPTAKPSPAEAKPKPSPDDEAQPSRRPKRPAPIAKLEADMVRVAGGSFIMGCESASRDGECYDREKPPRTVRVSPFSIGKYEVTQAQWRAVMGSDPPELYNKGCDDCPVEKVSWNDIQDFLRKLNAQTGKRYRLPTEAEWEYAARGGQAGKGNNYLYSGSNNIDEVAWYANNARSGNTHGAKKTTRPVGQKKANELGLYDMSGNVWEWCEDDWHDNYSGAPTDGRAWVDSPRGGRRVLRGGSWSTGAGNCRVALRGRYYPSARDYLYGFRLARD